MVKLIPRLPTVGEVIKLYDLNAKSQLSQNFLLDKNITDKLIKRANLNFKDALTVEVGPGPGLLTRSILEAGAKDLVVVEKDERFLPLLNQLSEVSEDSLKVISGDMLKVSSEEIFQLSNLSKSKVSQLNLIGNLPFNVATTLLLQWLNMSFNKSGIFEVENANMTLMFQKEVAERIAAKPSTSHRGRLSVMAQTVCKTNLIYQVPGSAFVPRPKVDATVIQLQTLPETKLKVPYKKLEVLVRIFFMKRRKTLRRIALDHNKGLMEAIDRLNLDTSMRPEDLEVDHWCDLANLIDNEHLIRAK